LLERVGPGRAREEIDITVAASEIAVLEMSEQTMVDGHEESELGLGNGGTTTL
jgi:hypothetical protein